jgi:hypothetical protein
VNEPSTLNALTEVTKDDWAEIKRLGLHNFGELRAWRRGEEIRKTMRERGINPDSPPPSSDSATSSDVVGTHRLGRTT